MGITDSSTPLRSARNDISLDDSQSDKLEFTNTYKENNMLTKTFSTGSLAYGSSSNAYVLDLVLTETAVSQTANESTVSYKLQLRSGSSNRFQWDVTAGLTLADKTIPSVTANKYLDYNSVWTLLSGSTTIPHNADGTKSMSFTASITVPSGNKYAPPSMKITGTMALTAIPRQSTVSATDSSVGAKTTIVIDRKNTAYTHTVQFQCGSMSLYLVSATGDSLNTPVKLTDTVLQYTLPTRLYSVILGTQATATITVCTYLGDTLIGSPATDTMVISINPALCTPVVGGTVKDVDPATLALTGDENCLVRYRSTALCTVQARARNNATLVSTTVNGQAVSGSLTIPNIQTADIVFQAIDSRGFTTVYRPANFTVIPYVPLSCNASVRRTDPTDSQAVLSVTGRCFTGSFGAAENTLSVTCRVADGPEQALAVTAADDSYTAQITLEDLDYRTAYPITVTVGDALETLERTVQLSRGIPVFDWGEEDFRFNVPVTAPVLNGFALRGTCANGNTATEPGLYTVTADTANVPITQGLLLVLYDGTSTAQVALGSSIHTRLLPGTWSA